MKQYNNYTADDFTFVVCAYQECEYLEEAIRSVRLVLQEIELAGGMRRP